MKTTALIMAGGRGERFWPKSRKSLPKQFLSLTGDGKTMIQLTIERILPLVNVEDIYIATNKDYKSLVLEQLPNIPVENILCEPIGRNTAPCIGLGAIHIAQKYNDAIMMVLPSDHLIKYNSIFINTLKDANEVAKENSNIVTIGITPDFPETNYGYIKFNTNECLNRAYSVDCFVEKPDFNTAKVYLSSNKYLWNSGIFIWKVSTILNKMKELMPETFHGLSVIQNAIGAPDEEDVLQKEFSSLPSISIDYGILEKSNDIYTIPGNFGWDDVGSWLAVERIRDANENGNILEGNIISINSNNCIIQSSNKLIATVGVDDLVIIDTDDATLICKKNCTSDIKKVIENLKAMNKIEYL